VAHIPFVTLTRMQNADELMNVHGVARVLRLPVTWLMAEADKGALPCLRIGRRRLFNIRAVKAALAERAAQTEPRIERTPV